MVKVTETTQETPLCPHCEQVAKEILAKKVQSTFGVRFVYFCAQCKKILGVSQRKGFWMG